MIKNPALRKTLSLAAYLMMAAIIAFLIADRHPPTLAVGVLGPIDEKIMLLDGTGTTFKRLLKKPMVINFWATWCPPCLKELPVFSKMAKKYDGKIIFVGAASNSRTEDILTLKQRFLLNYDLAFAPEQAIESWQARALPTTYLIDTSGTILWAKSGVLSEEQLEEALTLTLERSERKK